MDNDIDDERAKLLAEVMLKDHRAVVAINLGTLRGSSNNLLVIVGNYIGPEGAKALASAILQNRYHIMLSVLELGMNPIYLTRNRSKARTSSGARGRRL